MAVTCNSAPTLSIAPGPGVPLENLAISGAASDPEMPEGRDTVARVRYDIGKAWRARGVACYPEA